METNNTEKFYHSRITYLRFINRMTETELARKCQCSKQAICHYEKGIRIPKEPIVLMLCKVFNVSREVFFRYKFDIQVLGNNFHIVPDAITQKENGYTQR